MAIIADSPSEQQQKTRPHIGQKCIIKARAFKVYSHPDQYREHGRKKYPHTSRWISESVGEPLTAYYVGYRVVFEGITYLRYDGDYGQGFNYPEYHKTGHHTLWLVVLNERTQPIYVFPEDVEYLAVAYV